MMKQIVVFGATGGTGQEVVKQALQLDYQVTAFVRDRSKVDISDKNLIVVEGDLLDKRDIAAAVADKDGVFICLGAPPTDDSMIRSEATAVIVAEMEAYNVERLICQTTLGMGETYDMLSFQMRNLFVPMFMKDAFEDHRRQEAIIEKSPLKWTIVRPANLTDGPETDNYQVGTTNSANITSKISRADVASFMLAQIDNPEYIRKAVWISY